MKVLTVTPDKKLAFAEEPNPVLMPGKVIIKVAACAVNRADLLQVAGTYPSPAGWPDRPGLECSGTIFDAPANSRFHKGDKVCALLGGGGYAEYCAVPEEMVLPIPEKLSLEEAAGIPEVFATVYLNMIREAKMQDGETVFIQAGGSGIGMAAIQFCKMHNCKVLTSVGSDEKLEFVRKLGVDAAVNYKKEKIKSMLEEFAPDIVLDCVGGVDMGENVLAMAPWGRWIQIAAMAGGMTQLDLNAFFRKRLRLIGSTLRSRTEAVKGEILQAMKQELWPAFNDGRLKVVIYEKLSWEKASYAHSILKNSGNIGKVILTISMSS